MMYHHAKFGCKCKRSLEDTAETFIFWLNELSLSHWDLDPRDTKPNYVDALPYQIWLQKVEVTKYHPDKTGHRYNTPTPFHNYYASMKSDTYICAFVCDMDTICGKSIMMTWSLESTMRLNSLKSEWMTPFSASLTMSSIHSLYRVSMSLTACTWDLTTIWHIWSD